MSSTTIKQNQITMIARLREGERAACDKILEEKIGYQCGGAPGNENLRKIAVLHFVSLFTFDVPGGDGDYLVIEASFDGGPKDFLDEFVEKFEELDKILAHCSGFDNATKREFIESRCKTPDCFYVSCPGLARDQVISEQGLLLKLREEVDAIARDPHVATDRAEIVERLKERKARFSKEEYRGAKLADQAPAIPWQVRFRELFLPTLGVVVFVVALFIQAIFCPITWRHFLCGLAWLIVVALTLASAWWLYFDCDTKDDRCWKQFVLNALAIFVAGVALVEFAVLLWRVACSMLNHNIAFVDLPFAEIFRAAFVVVAIALALFFYSRLSQLSNSIADRWRYIAYVVASLGVAAALIIFDDFDHYALWAIGRGLSVFLLILLVCIAPIAAALLRIEYKERKDKPDWGSINIKKMHKAARNENPEYCLQNHFVNVSVIKGGCLRRQALKGALFAVHWLGVLLFNKGRLGPIPSIHFARWLVLDAKEFGQPLLLFITNYDGSWDSYLGDFVDGASMGISAIWSNTRGFPRTWWIILGGGSRIEKIFKAYARSGQHKSSAWYSAYPDVSVPQKLRNADMRRQIDQIPSGDRDPKAQEDLLQPL